MFAGLKRADYIACYEFCRRQRLSVTAAMVAGADCLSEIAFELECRQSDTLHAWKSRETYAPVDAMPEALDVACKHREKAAYQLLKDAPFADLAAVASACAHIKSAAHLVQRSLHPASDPQQSLFQRVTEDEALSYL